MDCRGSVAGWGATPRAQRHLVQPTLIVYMKPEMITTTKKNLHQCLGFYPFETEEEVFNSASDSKLGLGSIITTESVFALLEYCRRNDTRLPIYVRAFISFLYTTRDLVSTKRSNRKRSKME